jgi:hypothetical protein
MSLCKNLFCLDYCEFIQSKTRWWATSKQLHKSPHFDKSTQSGRNLFGEGDEILKVDHEDLLTRFYLFILCLKVGWGRQRAELVREGVRTRFCLFFF